MLLLYSLYLLYILRLLLCCILLYYTMYLYINVYLCYIKYGCVKLSPFSILVFKYFCMLVYLYTVLVSYTVIFVTVKYRRTEGLQGIPPALCPKFWTPSRLPPQLSEIFEMVFRVAPTRKIGVDKLGWGMVEWVRQWCFVVFHCCWPPFFEPHGELQLLVGRFLCLTICEVCGIICEKG